MSADLGTRDPSFWRRCERTEPRLSTVRRIDMEVLSAEQIRRMSVCEVTTTTLYQNTLPRANGLLDVRMGTCDRRIRCGTCKQDIIRCPGHHGHIELAAPIYHVTYISTLVKILRCVCPLCFRVQDTELGPSHGRKRFFATEKRLKTRRRCPHEGCGLVVPEYKQVSLQIRREWSPEALQQLGCVLGAKETLDVPGNYLEELLAPLTPRGVQRLLRLCGDNLRPLGIPHPARFVLTVLLVPPPIVRPTVMRSESSRTRGQDDLTLRLVEVVRCNQKIRNAAPRSNDRDALCDQLQMHVAAYMDSEAKGVKVTVKKRSGMPEKCVVEAFKGKTGRFRGNLMGKRVDFSARSTISPDGEMDVDEVGIPEAMARRLTFTEVVTAHNIRELSDLVRTEGAAKSVIRADGSRLALRYCRHPPRLQLGWRVERFMRDGDHVLLNRQPTLRDKSIMGHRVRLMPGKTIRLNPACTKPYNADFDGSCVCLFFSSSF